MIISPSCQNNNTHSNHPSLVVISQVVFMVKNQSINAGRTRDTGSIPGSRRCPRVGNGSPLPKYCLENSMDRGAWWIIAHRAAKSQT